MRSNLLACGFLACLGATVSGQAPGNDRPTKELLTLDSLAKLHTLIQPEAGEYRWDEIPWITSVWHARMKAAAENKPLLVFGTKKLSQKRQAASSRHLRRYQSNTQANWSSPR
jgi:hypothetical protein